jgi:hypothetical protein
MDRFIPPVTRRGLLITAPALIMASASADAEGAVAGTIEAMRGNAYAEGPKPRPVLQPMAGLFIGDSVETAISSAVTMHLGKVIHMKVGALAKFRIDNFVIDAGGTFDLEQGPILIEHNSGGKSENLQALAVRSDCRARYEILCDVFGVFLVQGLVALTGGGRTDTLGPELGINVANPGDIPAEPTRWGPGGITAARSSELLRGRPVSAKAKGGDSIGICLPWRLRTCEWVELLHRQPKVREVECQTDRNQATNYANSNQRDEIATIRSAILRFCNRLKFGWAPVFHRMTLIGCGLPRLGK